MTVAKDACALALELQSLTFDMSMVENLRHRVCSMRETFEDHLEGGVYDGLAKDRMEATVEALKKLEQACLDANTVMSERDQEIVWELSGRTSEVPEIYECPFCGGKAELYKDSDKGHSLSTVYVRCTECEWVEGPSFHASEFFGMFNPWRTPRNTLERSYTVKDAEIEAVRAWNRRVCGGKAIPAEKVFNGAPFRCPADVPDVKPCPLCGGEPYLYYDGLAEYVEGAQVECEDCCIGGPWRYGFELDPDEDSEMLAKVRKENPDKKILDSEGDMLRAAVEAWNHRVFGKEAGQ